MLWGLTTKNLVLWDLVFRELRFGSIGSVGSIRSVRSVRSEFDVPYGEACFGHAGEVSGVGEEREEESSDTEHLRGKGHELNKWMHKISYFIFYELLSQLLNLLLLFVE